MEKINVAQLLKDCPRGMELDCTIWDSEAKVFLDGVLDDDFSYPIEVTVKYNNIEYTKSFTKYGAFNDLPYCNCVIFPKGKTTWERFQRPFVDGDIVFYDNCVSIFKEWGDGTLFRNYVKVDIDGRRPMLCDRTHSYGKYIKKEARLATEEEKQKLFDAIKAKGYCWNPETKTLEELPKFNIGDRIKHKGSGLYCTLEEYSEGISAYRTSIGLSVTYKDLEQWELAPDKFDINTLVPFESKVLVRDTNKEKWKPNFWGFYDSDNVMNYPYECCGASFAQCIPYEGNEHLRGTTDDCDDYFKNWEG